MKHERFERKKLSTALILAIATLVLSMSGCTDKEPASPVSTEQTPKVEKTTLAYDSAGVAPAESWPKYEVESSHDVIQASAELLQGARIAMVNNAGWDNEKFEEFVRQCEHTTSLRTDGMVNIKITPFQPTTEAQNAAKKITDVETMTALEDPMSNTSLKPNEYASYQSAQAMPELGEYDKIISINAQELKPTYMFLGGAQSTEAGTIIDINSIGGLAATGHDEPSYRYADIYCDGNPENDLKVERHSFLHELLHLYGLDHNGTFYDGKKMLDVKDRKGEVIDLDNYLKSGSAIYDEYDSMTPMGNMVAMSMFTGFDETPMSFINNIHKYQLSNAARTLGWETTVKCNTIETDKPFMVTTEALSKETTLGYFDFGINLSLDDTAPENMYQEYQGLYFDTITNDGKIYRMGIVMDFEENKTGDIISIFAPEDGSGLVQDIRANGKLLRITVSSDYASVEQIS